MNDTTSLPIRVTTAEGSSVECPVCLGGGDSIRLEFDDWSRGRYLAADLSCDGPHIGILTIEFFAEGDDSPRTSCSMSFMPGLPCRFCFDLSWLDGQRVFPPRTPGRLKATCFGSTVPAQEIHHAVIRLQKTDHEHSATFGPFALSNTEPEYPLPDTKVVDSLGQWTARDWPGKCRTPHEMVASLRGYREAAPSAYPENWSRFGGDRNHRFDATGFFRCHRDERRWWLVDPEGYAFFSMGLDCVRPGVNFALVEGTEKLYEWIPEADGEYREAYSQQGPWGLPSADFGVANLIRAFGDNWRSDWEAVTTHRLRQWRFNTIANWSDLSYARRSGIPYVIPMREYPSTKIKLFRDLPDVFDPAFETAAGAYASYLEQFRDDPFLVGYFLANEPKWGFGAYNLAAEMLEANPGTHTRKALAEFLSGKYGGDSVKWSEAWKMAPRGFDAVENACFHRVAHQSPQAHADCWEFSAQIVRRFVRIPSEACRRVDPQHLNLGLRYAWIASDLFYLAGEYFDVFSINCYEMEPSAETIAKIAEKTGRPVMIGEFHFGAMDRGLPATGLRGVASQRERGVAYRRFMEMTAANPDMVGAHYFTLYDEAVLGRGDGENWQIGLLDVCNRPYEEISAAVALTHEGLYDVCDGSIEPSQRKADETARLAH